MIFLGKNKMANTVLDGIDSLANVLTAINPILAGITIITFVIKQIINYADSDAVIKRIKKLDKQLSNKKIDMEDFKNKILKLSEHEAYIVKNNLKNILLNCIPETVDIYISIWIDLIMNDDSSIHEELCEILTSLNKNDLILLEMIKSFTKYGEKSYYISSEISNEIRDQEIAKTNEKIKKYNSKTKGIKKLEYNFSDRDVRIGNKTIFWKDFAKYYNIKVGEMGYMLLAKATNENGDKAMIWAYYVRSFIKLDRLGVLQLDYYSTLGTVNSLNIDRFHITLFGEKLLKYIQLKSKKCILA